MELAKNFQDLTILQKAHELTLLVYKATYNFPREEIYGLTSQIRRAGYSVPMNISEGFKRKSDLDKLRFYNYSQASLEELRYCLILSKDLNYINDTENFQSLLDEVSRLLYSYVTKIENNRK